LGRCRGRAALRGGRRPAFRRGSWPPVEPSAGGGPSSRRSDDCRISTAGAARGSQVVEVWTVLLVASAVEPLQVGMTTLTVSRGMTAQGDGARVTDVIWHDVS
jgi:hypothetical protein